MCLGELHLCHTNEIGIWWCSIQTSGFFYTRNINVTVMNETLNREINSPLCD